MQGQRQLCSRSAAKLSLPLHVGTRVGTSTFSDHMAETIPDGERRADVLHLQQ